MADESLRKRLEARFTALKSERSGWEGDWRKIVEVIAPNRGRFASSDRNKASRRNGKRLIRNAGRFGLRTLAAGMQSGLTSPSQPWFRLETDDPELSERPGVRAWLDAVEAVIYRIFAVSGFYQTAHAAYYEMGGFGQCPIYMGDDFENIVSWRPFTVGEYWIGTGHEGTVTSMHHESRWTVEQAVHRFGLKAVSRTVREQWDKGNYHSTLDIRFAIEPRGPRFAGDDQARRTAYFCAWWEPGAEGDRMLAVDPHDAQPFFCPRWDVLAPDPYGWAPAYDALGDVLELQLTSKRITQAIDKSVHPPMQGPAQYQQAGVNTLPGAYNVVGQGQQIAPLYPPGAFDLQSALLHVQSIAHDIREAFFADLFLMMQQDQRSNITAREIEERHAEKMLQLGPVLDNLGHEWLNPLIDRVFARIVDLSQPLWPDAGVIPPPPDDLGGTELQVSYISSLAQAQRMLKAAPIYRLIDATAQLMAFDPQASQKLDSHQALDEIARATGAPAKVLRDDETVAAMQAASAQQQQQAEQLQAGGMIADAAGKLGRAKVDGTALGRLVGGADG